MNASLPAVSSEDRRPAAYTSHTTLHVSSVEAPLLLFQDSLRRCAAKALDLVTHEFHFRGIRACGSSCEAGYQEHTKTLTASQRHTAAGECAERQVKFDEEQTEEPDDDDASETQVGQDGLNYTYPNGTGGLSEGLSSLLE
ncbi:hypothetical protein BESB_071760 [Besnoitia besnoiti]|uniref:Uncharacterized protein n=1 Tax=Besnoitia besnoiti TaxID=94643 RepID=A0A2A9M9Z8_BESBE|nr:uncharacterized protein BESB_071760 [Besnoitia besnoiti]PFH34024.1 hypothetical protein BESB_071760 [Besnoitia besnoiti]